VHSSGDNRTDMALSLIERRQQNDTGRLNISPGRPRFVQCFSRFLFFVYGKMPVAAL
jgi:hypothetical protein